MSTRAGHPRAYLGRQAAHLEASSGASPGPSGRRIGLRQPLRSAGRTQCRHMPHFSAGRTPLPWPCRRHSGHQNYKEAARWLPKEGSTRLHIRSSLLSKLEATSPFRHNRAQEQLVSIHQQQLLKPAPLDRKARCPSQHTLLYDSTKPSSAMRQAYSACGPPQVCARSRRKEGPAHKGPLEARGRHGHGQLGEGHGGLPVQRLAAPAHGLIRPGLHGRRGGCPAVAVAVQVALRAVRRALAWTRSRQGRAHQADAMLQNNLKHRQIPWHCPSVCRE
jgi:hypothetical protein